MEVDTCLLCEAATVRGGLLYILGGGITHMIRPAFPAPLDMALALRIIGEPDEATQPHALEIVLVDPDAEDADIVRVKIAVEVAPELGDNPSPEILLAWDFPARPLIPHAGQYSFDILVDDAPRKSVPFTAAMEGGD